MEDNWPHPITRMTCLDIARTLHELANEGKLISGHALNIMLQGTNWGSVAKCHSPIATAKIIIMP